MSSSLPQERSFGEQSRLRWHLINFNDGIISAAGIIEGFSSAGARSSLMFTAGVLVLLAGAAAIGGLMYAEVAAERDATAAVIEAELRRLEQSPTEELAELVEIYQVKGLSHDLAVQVAEELSARDALAAQLDAEYGLSPDPGEIHPLRDALLAGLGFMIGAVAPVLIVLVTARPNQFEVTFIAVVVALALSGYLEARTGGGRVGRAMARTVGLGAAAMLVTSAAGRLLGV